MHAATVGAVGVVVLGLGSAVLGCDGSGGRSTTHPPFIQDLQLSETAVVDGVTGQATLSGSVAFRDPGGDVTSATIRSDLGTSTLPIPAAEGITAGTGTATLTVVPGRYGASAFEVWLVDRAGLESNHLSGTVTFVPENTGQRWTRVSSLPAEALVQAPGSSGARFVAVGSGGVILTSSDGILWSQQPSPVAADLHAVAWSGSLFVAVGENSTIVTSADGSSWVARGAPIAGARLYAVAWGGEAFVAVGGDVEPVAFVSSDGISWTRGTGFEIGSPGPLFAVAWGAGRWVAAGPWRWVSSDGTSWSRAPGDYLAMASLAIGWNGERFVTIGAGGGWSADGLTWTLSTDRPGGYPIWGLAWSGSRWLALSADGASTSADGSAWNVTSLTPTPFVIPPVVKVVWDGERFPARFLAAGGGGIWTSP